MSDPRLNDRHDFAPNLATSQEGSTLARRVHDRGVLVRLAVAGSLGGCVFPPDLSVGNQDAGINSPPAILGIRTEDQELPEPGPPTGNIFLRGEGTFSAEVIDTDLNDDVFVQAFVNYTVEDPSPARVRCSSSGANNTKAVRTLTCNTNALCLQQDVTSGDTLNMSIVVFDREPLESGDPPHQAMPPGGLSTSRFYFIQCKEPMLP
jgi:hypothetical protein